MAQQAKGLLYKNEGLISISRVHVSKMAIMVHAGSPNTGDVKKGGILEVY